MPNVTISEARSKLNRLIDESAETHQPILVNPIEIAEVIRARGIHVVIILVVIKIMIGIWEMVMEGVTSAFI